MSAQQFPLPAEGLCPPGWELVVRTAIVRLGSDLSLYTDTNHASLGVESVTVDEGWLEVRTDFDGAREKCLSATASVDATLAGKGVFVGASGGASLTRYALYSARTLGHYPAFSRIPASSTVFSSAIDNLWITHLSLRRVAQDGGAV
ncbi:hypothetical protein GCM10008944_01690 [Cytobacillus oceanisediminis]